MPVRDEDFSKLLKGGLVIFGGGPLKSLKKNSPEEPKDQSRPATKEDLEEFERNDDILMKALRRNYPEHFE